MAIKYNIDVPLIELITGTDDEICRPYHYNFYLISKDGTFPKVILLKQRTLPDNFLQTYTKFLFLHPKYEPQDNGAYADLSKDGESSFKTLFIKPIILKANQLPSTVQLKTILKNDVVNALLTLGKTEDTKLSPKKTKGNKSSTSEDINLITPQKKLTNQR